MGSGIGSVVQQCRPVFLWFFTYFLYVSQLYHMLNEHKKGVWDPANENKALPRYFKLQWLDCASWPFLVAVEIGW